MTWKKYLLNLPKYVDRNIKTLFWYVLDQNDDIPMHKILGSIENECPKYIYSTLNTIRWNVYYFLKTFRHKTEYLAEPFKYPIFSYISYWLQFI